MNKEKTIGEAWDDFFVWVKTQPAWKQMSRTQRQYIYRTNIDRKKGVEMEVRIRTLLTRYGAGRYEFRGAVIIHE